MLRVHRGIITGYCCMLKQVKLLSTLGNCQNSGIRPVDGVLVIIAVFGWCRLDVADTIDVIVKATGSFMLLNSFYRRSARMANVVVITVF